MLKTEIERAVTEFTGASTLGDGIRRCASVVRADAGETSIPVNVRAIATHLGVRAIQVRDIACDGALMPLETNNGYAVSLSCQTSSERQRFSLAHELGHIVLHRLIPETRSFETRTFFTPPGSKTEERFCDAFAAELLMPHDAFLATLTKVQMNIAGLIDLALTFRVSVTAAAHRIRETALCRDFALLRLRRCGSEQGVLADKVLVNFRRSRLRAGLSHKFIPQSAPSKALSEAIYADGWELLQEGKRKRWLHFSVAPSSMRAASSIALVTKSEHQRWRLSVAPLCGPDENTRRKDLLPKLPENHLMTKSNRNSGTPWKPQEVKELRSLARGNTPTGVIGLKLGRTSGAIYAKASEKQISLKPTNQSPYNRRKK